MGWSKAAALGDNVIEVAFSSTGRFNRHFDRGEMADEMLRLSGRRVRVVMRRRTWDDLTDKERQVRLRDRS